MWHRMAWTNLDLDPLRLGDRDTERDLEGDRDGDGDRDTADRPDPLPDTTDPSESDISTVGVTFKERGDADADRHTLLLKIYTSNERLELGWPFRSR